jgi:hypothetical protein
MGIVSFIVPAPGNYGRIQSRNFCFDAFPELESSVQLKRVTVVALSRGPGKLNMVEATIRGSPCFAWAISMFIYSVHIR